MSFEDHNGRGWREGRDAMNGSQESPQDHSRAAVSEEPIGLTQTLGWVGAWTSRPSVYAVAAKSAADIAAAVNFARTHNLRLVVKGCGHSYQGTSNAADSLLIWTRPMEAVVLHDAFVGSGCEGIAQPQPAVSIEAVWGRVYQEDGQGRTLHAGRRLLDSGRRGSLMEAASAVSPRPSARPRPTSLRPRS
jgi:hypothetical protein